MLILALLGNVLLAVSFKVAHAYPVPPLPEDNLIVNPWFRNGNMPGFSGWSLPLNEEGLTWGPSQKESNPSPDIVVSGTCGGQIVYCGTAARWAEQEKVYYPNIDVFAYQIVSTDASNRKLKFFAHFVSHRVDVGAVNIYGGQSNSGPWEHVWTPLFHSQSENIVPESGEIRDLWIETGFLEKTLEEGFPYYKVELQSRLPELRDDMIRGGGFKITGIYFSTAFTDESADPPSIDSAATTQPAPGEGQPEPTISGTAESFEGVIETPVAPVVPDPRDTEVPRATEITEVTEPQTNDQGLPTISAEAISATDIAINLSSGYSRRVRLERSVDGITGWRPVTTLTAGTTEYVDSDLPSNTILYYRIRVSQTETSDVISAQTAPLLEPTSVPVTATSAPAVAEVPQQQPESQESQAIVEEEAPIQRPLPQPSMTSTGFAFSKAIYLMAIALILFVTILVGMRLIWIRRRSH